MLINDADVCTVYNPVQSTICSLACLTFSIELNLPHYRLQSTFILLLTTVTFKFV